MNRYPLQVQMLQLHSFTAQEGSSKGGDCCTVYVKLPQWQEPVYVALGGAGLSEMDTEDIAQMVILRLVSIGWGEWAHKQLEVEQDLLYQFSPAGSNLCRI